MMEIIAIPRQRKPVLIGRNGSVKERIEKETKTKIRISEDVKIEGEALSVLKAKDIVRAIARGFSPEKAFMLLDEDCQLDIITLVNENENTRERLFARVIGRKGKTRNIIEQKTGAFLSVYGKTVAIIGRHDQLSRARLAVEHLLEGRTHKSVYAMLCKK